MDFLTFKSFISTDALILFYYLGAVVIPVLMWLLSLFLIRKYKLFDIAYESAKTLLWKLLNRNQKIKLAAFFIILFLFMELFWRMLFEFLIAYMQMRNALLQLA